jgi:two-component system, sensor histidine kinase
MVTCASKSSCARPQILAGNSGAGLGLAIAKKLVEMMNGKIGLESRPNGEGSLAWFTLPLSLSSEQQAVEGCTNRIRPIDPAG